MRRLSFLAVVFVLGQMIYRACADTQQCPAFGSEQSIYGWMLQRHIYKTMKADLGLHCMLVCRTDDRCQSVNFVMSLHMCEFSDRTKEARPEDFIPDPDRYYFRRDIKRVPLGSIPELAAVSCREIKASEGQATSGKYWLTSIKPNKAVLAHCDMETGDVDECSASSPVCDVNAICNNTIGSYRCTCNPGHAGDGKTCKDVDECSASSPVCDVNAICNNTIGSYRCTCNPGHAGDGKTCKDVDECSASSPVCDVNAICNNTIGSYRCTCNPGHAGDGKTCKDIDECSTNSHSCNVNAVCSNTDGSHTCACNSGYSGDGKTCTDIDECVSGVHGCVSSGSCTNTLGSYSCSCNHPFVGSGKNCRHSASECKNYYSLNSTDRKINYTSYHGYCDRGMTHGWYRFEGAAGKRMASSCPSINRCGTRATGWLTGGHPNVADGQVNRTVCFHWSSRCCRWSTTIQVRDCGSFYVYYLSGTPGCPFRFCGTD